jgi:hypothetical protein
MKKLLLDALEVESFATDAASPGIRGTVHAHRTFNCDSLMPDTCWVTCADSCSDRCPDTDVC